MEKTATEKRFSTKGFTSLLLAFSLSVMAVSGILLYLSPRGRVANWTDWTLLGLGKEEWGAVHITNGLLFLIAAAVHLALNWTLFWGYVKRKAVAGLNLKRELALAGAIAAVVVAGTLYGLPPFSTLVAWQHDIKDYWERRSAQAPAPHAEEFTLTEFAGHINLPVEDVSDALRSEGYDVEGTTVTLAELADRKGVAPSEIFRDVQKHFPSAAGLPRRGAGRGPGWDCMHGSGAGTGGGGSSEHQGEGGEPAQTGKVESGQATSLQGEPTHGDGESVEREGQGLGPGQGSGVGRGMGGFGGRGPGFGQGGGAGGGRGYGQGLGPGQGQPHTPPDEQE